MSCFLNWVCWTRGNYSGEPGHVRILVCITPVWSAGPVRIYLVILLEWVAGRYGSFVLLALFWRVCLIERVGGVAGRYDFSCLSTPVPGGTVRLKWRGVLYLNFHFLQFAVNCLGGRICAVGILSFISVVFCSGFSWFFLLIC